MDQRSQSQYVSPQIYRSRPPFLCHKACIPAEDQTGTSSQDLISTICGAAMKLADGRGSSARILIDGVAARSAMRDERTNALTRV